MWLELKRVLDTSTETLGLFMYQGRLLGFCIEPPWRDNESNISSIPVGKYPLEKTFSGKHGNCFKLMKVPGRSDILIHSGNSVLDTEGCLIPGSLTKGINTLEGKIFVYDSKITCTKLKDLIDKQGIKSIVIS